ncbi:hypothetical protein [Glycomyces sp. NPDC048151]|uniref:hypothetical protein n=1 Tax=Glycomyces sp. NPDC048151 TaxID=3364002 RepID=UPI00371DC24B
MRDVLAHLGLLALSAVIAVAVGFLDEPVFGTQIPWWVCALIGLAVVYGGLVVVVVADE